MNDSYRDMYSALAAERIRSLQADARQNALVRVARSSAPTRFAVLREHLVDGVSRASQASLRWLRKGQLAGYPDTCVSC